VIVFETLVWEFACVFGKNHGVDLPLKLFWSMKRRFIVLLGDRRVLCSETFSRGKRNEISVEIKYNTSGES